MMQRYAVLLVKKKKKKNTQHLPQQANSKT